MAVSAGYIGETVVLVHRDRVRFKIQRRDMTITDNRMTHRDDLFVGYSLWKQMVQVIGTTNTPRFKGWSSKGLASAKSCSLSISGNFQPCGVCHHSVHL